MSLEYDDDGVPEIFKKVYEYFSDDEKMWDVVNNLAIIGIKEREYREISQMVDKKAGKGAIRKKVLETSKKYDKLTEISPKKGLSDEEMFKYLEDIQKNTNCVIIQNEEEKAPKIKNRKEKESINSRQKSFRARKALENTKRVSFYLSEEKKARMDAMRIKRGITQEELLNEMIENYCKNQEEG